MLESGAARACGVLRVWGAWGAGRVHAGRRARLLAAGADFLPATGPPLAAARLPVPALQRHAADAALKLTVFCRGQGDAGQNLSRKIT